MRRSRGCVRASCVRAVLGGTLRMSYNGRGKPRMVNIEQSEVKGVRVVRLSGSLDRQGLQQIETAFRDAISSSAKDAVVVDLSGVSLIATPGITMLLSAHRSTVESGGRMVLTGINKFMNDIKHLYRLDAVFTLIHSVDVEIAACQT